MEYAIIILLSIAILLLVLSFTGTNKIKNIESQLEQVSLQVMQETYLLKKKLKILEEELLMNDIEVDVPEAAPANITIDSTKIMTKFKQGHSYEEIARQSNLPIEEVRLILEHARKMEFDL